MTKRDRIVLMVVGAAAVLAAFWMLALAPKREKAAQIKDEVAKEEKRRDDARARVRAGEEARRSFADDYATVARLGKAVPVDDQTPSLLYQLETEARKRKIDLRVMKVRQAPGANASTPSQPGNGSSSSSSSGGSPTPGAVPQATQAAAAVAPPGSAIGSAGFPTLPFSFTFEGDFFKMERLFSAIERFTTTQPDGEDVDVRGRLVTIDAFVLSQGWEWPRVAASVNATAYVLPPGEGTTAAVDPSSPAGAAAPAQTASGTTSKPTTATATAGGLTP
ncbi:MAG TPA: hypothetical protein VF529_13360 [Solirubrobacteraceae bacterium]